MTEPTRAQKLQALRDRMDDLSLETLAEEYLEARENQAITNEYVGSLEQRILARMAEEDMDLLPTPLANFKVSYRTSYDWHGIDRLEAALAEVGLDPEDYLSIETTYRLKDGTGGMLWDLLLEKGISPATFIDKRRSTRPRNSRILMGAVGKLGSRGAAIHGLVTTTGTRHLNVEPKVDRETGEVFFE